MWGNSEECRLRDDHHAEVASDTPDGENTSPVGFVSTRSVTKSRTFSFQ